MYEIGFFVTAIRINRNGTVLAETSLPDIQITGFKFGAGQAGIMRRLQMVLAALLTSALLLLLGDPQTAPAGWGHFREFRHFNGSKAAGCIASEKAKLKLLMELTFKAKQEKSFACRHF